MGFSNYLVTKTGLLVRAVVQSPNFATGVSGWQLAKNGSAEFNDVTIRGGEVISGTTLVYNGTPAAGNLIYSIAKTGGTDPYGNVYYSGAVAYNGAFVAQTYGGQFTVSDSVGNGVIYYNAGMYILGGPIYIDPLTAIVPGTVATPETWHDLRPLSNSFTGTVSGYYPPQYRANPLGRVEVFGVVGLPGTYNSVTFATLPAAYRPSKTVYMPVEVLTNAGSAPGNSMGQYVAVDSSGNLQFHGLPAGIGAGPVFIDVSFPLDSTGLIES